MLRAMPPNVQEELDVDVDAQQQTVHFDASLLLCTDVFDCAAFRGECHCGG